MNAIEITDFDGFDDLTGLRVLDEYGRRMIVGESFDKIFATCWECNPSPCKLYRLEFKAGGFAVNHFACSLRKMRRW